MVKRTGTYFEDDVDFTFTPCRDPEHEPPGHIVIPSGKRLVHICPSCKNKTVIRAESFSLTTKPTRHVSSEQPYKMSKTPRVIKLPPNRATKYPSGCKPIP